jgi:glycosyltransferase involved in cell wall biosynthesis
VGRISRIKRQDLAIEALGKLRANKDIDACLSIVGTPLTNEDRMYEVQLQNLVHELNLERCVIWKGAVSNTELPKYLWDSDRLIHTSETGSLDKVILEALASGLFIVTTSRAVKEALPKDIGTASYAEGNREALSSQILDQIHKTPELTQYQSVAREFVIAHHDLSLLVGRIIQFIGK